MADENTPGGGGGGGSGGGGGARQLYLLSDIKVFGLQSAAMSSRNSESLLPESSYTSAIHVYIHQPC